MEHHSEEQNHKDEIISYLNNDCNLCIDVGKYEVISTTTMQHSLCFVFKLHEIIVSLYLSIFVNEIIFKNAKASLGLYYS